MEEDNEEDYYWWIPYPGTCDYFRMKYDLKNNLIYVDLDIHMSIYDYRYREEHCNNTVPTTHWNYFKCHLKDPGVNSARATFEIIEYCKAIDKEPKEFVMLANKYGVADFKLENDYGKIDPFINDKIKNDELITVIRTPYWSNDNTYGQTYVNIFYDETCEIRFVKPSEYFTKKREM